MANEDLSKLTIDKSGPALRPRRKKKVFRWAVAVLVAMLIGTLLYKEIFSPSVSVEVATVGQVYPSQTFTVLNASGYVVAQRKAAVASKATGRLVALYVEEGNRVKRGDVVARLESEDASAAKEQAEHNLDVARSNLEQARAESNEATLLVNRNKDLLGRGFISQTEYDSSEARYKKAVAAVRGMEAAIKAATAALRAADVSLEYTYIRAPFDAVVLTKNADIGDIVTPLGAAANAKAAVVTIADMSSLQVEVDVSESNLQLVKVGQPCEIQLDALPEVRFRGEVHMVVPTADRTKATVLVKVRFLDKDSRILPEMSAKVAFLQRPVNEAEMKPRIAVLPENLVARNGKVAAVLFRAGLLSEVPVTTGEKIGDMIEVLSGVNAGDRIVRRPTDRMKHGMKATLSDK